MSTPAPNPTGRRESRGEDGGGGDAIVFDRSFDSTPAEVWAALTEPTLLERWIGTWSGDSASGRVVFRMTSEGDDVPDEAVTILACTPGERLGLEIGVGADADAAAWKLELTLESSSADGPTTLHFAQLLDDTSGIGDIAPGWEYYLDRLAAVLDGGNPSLILFDDYHPGMSEHYRAMFA
ncbi:SRPBCC domain-containing protein [Herbiconiux liukaitaii]|uniref:SRPBCC domain-containing protein n=1 Tax=Herbiconiux liukaitaii TaxID=3342799 RepID=UPI0035BA6B6A